MDSCRTPTRYHPNEAGRDQSMTLQVRNVVASGTVAEALRLDELAAAIPDATFDRGFPRLFLRLPDPRATALIFGSGKVVLTGLRTPDAIAPAHAAVVRALIDAGARLHEPVPAPRLVNLVASGDLGGRVALHRLAVSRDFERVEFDPEQFPGLVYRAEGGGVALVFGSGSIVVTGARTDEGAQAVGAEVRDIISAAGAWHPQ